MSTLPTLHLLIARPDHIGPGRACRCTTRSCGRCGSGELAFRSGKIIGYDVNISVDFVRESSTFGFILAREGPLSRGDPEGGARLAFPRLRSQRRLGRFGNRPPGTAANEGSRSGRKTRRGNEQECADGKVGRVRQVRHGPCGSALAGPFGRTKPTVDLLDRITAWSPAAPASRAGQSATRCPASLGQHKSLPRKALSRVVPLSRGCGMGTLRQAAVHGRTKPGALPLPARARP